MKMMRMIYWMINRSIFDKNSIKISFEYRLYIQKKDKNFQLNLIYMKFILIFVLDILSFTT